MTAKELFEFFSNHQDDYEFTYKGKRGAVCIFANEIVAGYDGSELSFRTLEEVMSAKFINGRTLSDVAEEITVYG